MNTALKTALGVIAAVALVVLGLGAGWLVWGRWLWQPGLIGGPGMMWSRDTQGSFFPWMMDRWDGPRQRGFGMMGGWNGVTDEDCPMSEIAVPGSAGQISIGEAESAVEEYIAGWNDDLEIAELMEFEHNYYAIVREHDTGIGAMELPIDKATGDVAPEIGPNMMWNARYGMHARRNWMDISGGVNKLSEPEAVAVAQKWLDEHKPGVRTEEHAGSFYGYYTIHTVRGGQIDGMLSVHGETGRVWDHTWHGAFVEMLEPEGQEH